MSRTYLRLLSVVVLAAALGACGSPEQRAANYLARAEALFQQEDFESAKLEAQNAVQIQPRNMQARWLLARIARAEAKPLDALKQLPIVVDEDPGNAEARVQLAEIILASGNAQGARELTLEAAGIDADNPYVLQMQARLAQLDGDVDSAMAYLDRLLAIDPQNVSAALQRGLTLLNVSPQRAYEDLSESIRRVGKDNAKALRQARIDVLNLMGRKDEAGVELKSLLDDYPGDQNIVNNAAKFFLAEGNAEAAENVLRGAVDAAPDDPQALFSLAVFQSRTLGQPDVAESTFAAFIRENPDNLEARVMLGTFYEGLGRVPEAREVYRGVIADAAESDEGIAARNRIAATLAVEGDSAAAVRELDAVLATDPGNVGALLLRGELAFNEGRYAEAVADLRGVVRGAPDNEAALLLLARSHTATGESALAEDAYRRALEVSPTNATALGELAVILQQRRQFDDAQVLYERLLALDENSAVALSGLVETALGQGDLDAAESHARALVAVGDPLGIGSIQLGKVFQAREAFPAAAGAFEDALLQDPASVVALRGLVGSWTAAGQLERGGSAAERFIDANPTSVPAMVLLGGNLLRRGQPAAAREPLEQAISLEPDNVQAFIVLASTYAKDPQQRVETLRRGLEANPGQVDLALLLGGLYSRQGNSDEAIDVYQRSLAVNPGEPRIANNLASLLLESRGDEASRQRALELARGLSESRDPAQLDTLGWAYFRNGEPQRAVQFLERALALGGDLPIVHYHLASAYAAAGNRVGAERQLAAFLDLVPADNPRRAEAESDVRRLLSADAT